MIVPNKRRLGWRRFWPWGLAAMLLALLGFLVIPPELGADRPYSTVLFDRDGQLLGATIAADQQWRFPPRETLPPRYVSALVAFEDQRFFRHIGVDPLALLRATFSNLSAGRIVSGGSTIPMQTIRLLRGNPPRTFGEKLRELLLALRLEGHLRKPEILALYAAHAPFGGNVVGLEAASWRYFGRAPEQLSWAEAATLAVLPNAPGLIHPGRGREHLLAKRNRLLRVLERQELLSTLDRQLAEREPLPAAPLPFPDLASHLLRRAEHRGQRVDSALDGPLQQKAKALMAWHGKRLASENVPNAALLILDNRDFSVRAYVGNTPIAADQQQGQDIDLIQRPRSSGSILKPFLYALMLENGEILPTSLVPDVPTQINGYVPENFDNGYRGAVPAAEALALSLNIPAVRLLREHGVEAFYLQLQQMGMQTLFRRAEDYGLTLILGGAETTLWDLASMYGNLAAISGQRAGNLHYRRAQLYRQQTPESLAPAEYGPGAAYLTLTAMAEVNRPGLEAYWKQFSSSRQVAWKTGTSYGLRDAWAVAVTPEYTVAVWAGDAHGHGIAGLSGSQTAAPLLFDALNLLPETSWFVTPQADLKSLQVCAADGYLPRENCPLTTTLAPLHSHFDRGSRWHRQLHTDTRSNLRVNARCRLPGQMQAVTWFQLPPGMEYYYRRHHPGYQRLPPLAPDCKADDAAAEVVMELLYPEQGAQLYIPTELNGQRQAVIAQAVHRHPDTTIYWHLDQHYLGSTRQFHQQLIEAGYGEHTLTLIDEQGKQLSRRFFVRSATP